MSTTTNKMPKTYRTNETVVVYFWCFILHLLLKTRPVLLLNTKKAFAVASLGSTPNPTGGTSPIVGCLAPLAFDVSVPIWRLDRDRRRWPYINAVSRRYSCGRRSLKRKIFTAWQTRTRHCTYQESQRHMIEQFNTV
jgi:hypothetical protein